MIASRVPSPPIVVAVEPLLVGAVLAGRLVGVSGRTWQRLSAGGETPPPVHLGGKRLYSIATLRRWVEAGCPSRERFEDPFDGRKIPTTGVY